MKCTIFHFLIFTCAQGLAAHTSALSVTCSRTTHAQKFSIRALSAGKNLKNHWPIPAVCQVLSKGNY